MKPQSILAAAPGSLAALWWGWIIAPTWWLSQFELRYALVPWACRHEKPDLVPLVGMVAFAISLGLVGWAWSNARKNGHEERAFLRHGGVGIAALFSFLILMQLLPDLFLGVCRQ